MSIIVEGHNTDYLNFPARFIYKQIKLDLSRLNIDILNSQNNEDTKSTWMYDKYLEAGLKLWLYVITLNILIKYIPKWRLIRIKNFSQLKKLLKRYGLSWDFIMRLAYYQLWNLMYKLAKQGYNVSKFITQRPDLIKFFNG